MSSVRASTSLSEKVSRQTVTGCDAVCRLSQGVVFTAENVTLVIVDQGKNSACFRCSSDKPSVDMLMAPTPPSHCRKPNIPQARAKPNGAAESEIHGSTLATKCK